MSELRLRKIERADRAEVAELIYVGTNYWYESHGRPPVFSGSPDVAEVYFDVYEALDPGCGIVVEDPRTGRLAGSCFIHPRDTHVSLGIMNTHPGYTRQGVARILLNHITEFTDRQGKPLRLVSSAMNLDSFSLYTRSGFVPRCVYQDMFVEVPDGGLNWSLPGADRIRNAKPDDVPAIAALEMELAHINRQNDHRYFVENTDGFWHVSVYENQNGKIDGFLVSCAHPGSNMIGPGVSRTEDIAAALIERELNHHKGRSPVFLVPAECDRLVRELYARGARNCELHFGQVRGEYRRFDGVFMPTFLPESA